MQYLYAKYLNAGDLLLIMNCIYFKIMLKYMYGIYYGFDFNHFSLISNTCFGDGLILCIYFMQVNSMKLGKGKK